MEHIDYFIARRIWWLWLLCIVIAFAVQSITLDVLPHLQQDEAQITDYGRLVLHPYSGWSVTWWVAKNKPLLLWSYLGPLFAEVSFLLGGASGLGPRVASLFGGFIAATMAFKWLLARKVSVYAAFGLGIAFMLDPLFVLSQRMARVDSWVMACCLTSCYILSRHGNSKRNDKTLMVAGGFAAAAAFIWPSAVLLYPLVVLELVKTPDSVKDEADVNYSLQYRITYFVIGGVFVSFLLLLPVWQNLVVLFEDMGTVVTQNIDSSQSFGTRIIKFFDYHSWLKLLKALVKTFTPLLPLMAVAGAILGREKKVIFATLFCLLLIFASLVYEFRVLYLLPYCLVLSSSLFTQRNQKKLSTLSFSGKWVFKFSSFALGLLVVWAVVISLVARTALGLQGKADRDRSGVFQAAATSIGSGNYKVFLGFTYEFYFVGRSLGWQLYTPYIQFTYDKEGNWIRVNDYEPKDKIHILFSQMDYAVFAAGSVSQELSKELNISGLFFCQTIHVGKKIGNGKEDKPLLNRSEEILMWFLEGKRSYGSFVVYSRMQPVNLSLKSDI